MKRIAALSLFFRAAFSLVAQVADEEAIRKNFEDYSTALVNQNGEEAANLVGSRTIHYYNIIAEMVRDADSVKVQSLPTLDKIMVLVVRQKVPKEDLLSFDGKALFVYAINHGMIEKRTVGHLKLGAITTEKDSAKAQLVVQGTEFPQSITFHKEGGQWKYDLTSSFPLAMPAIQKLIDEFGEKTLIDWMLNADPQNKPSPYIWRSIR